MQAFPKDSRNMQLGGSGPINSRLNLDQIHGTGQEAHIDFNEAAIVDDDAAYMSRIAPVRSANFNPLYKTEPLHGQESAGLGTSTFLEGAPASRSAIQQRESESESQPTNSGGLSRKKSLAQKIRAVRPGGGRTTSPERPPNKPASPLGATQGEIATNPFVKENDQENDRKGAQIAFTQVEQKTGRARATSSPKRAGLGLERKMTLEGMGGIEEAKSSGGFLSRVKSMKGKSKARGERRDVSG
jgi:Pal1 cell morphology protein